MTAAVILFVVLVSILVGAVVLVRYDLSKPDPWDFCDACASEPMPLEAPSETVAHVRAHQPWGAPQ